MHGRPQAEELLLAAGGESARRPAADLDTSARTSPSVRYVWYVISLLAVVNAFAYMDRMALSVLMPSIKSDLKLSDSQLGVLSGLAFFIFYAICGIPIARWADRGIRRNIIAVTLSIWSLMTALCGAVQNFWHLLATRVGLGAGEAGCIPAAESIISDYVPPKSRPGAYALHAFGYSAGTMLGLLLGGWLGQLIGWRSAFVALGLPGLLLALLVIATLREPVRGASDGVTDELVPSLRETITVLCRCTTYRRATVYLVVNGFAYAGLLQWWPSFYERTYGSTLSSVGVGLGLAIGIGSSVGTIIGGILSNKLGQYHTSAPLRIGVAALAFTLPAMLGALFSSSAPVSMFLAFATILFWSVPSGPINATIFTVTRPRMRATASAFNIFLISVLGFGQGPFCVGLLSDRLAPTLGAQSLRYALLLPVSAIAALVVLLHWVARALPNDLKTVAENRF